MTSEGPAGVLRYRIYSAPTAMADFLEALRIKNAELEDRRRQLVDRARTRQARLGSATRDLAIRTEPVPEPGTSPLEEGAEMISVGTIPEGVDPVSP